MTKEVDRTLELLIVFSIDLLTLKWIRYDYEQVLKLWFPYQSWYHIYVTRSSKMYIIMIK